MIKKLNNAYKRELVIDTIFCTYKLKEVRKVAIITFLRGGFGGMTDLPIDIK